VRRHALSRTNAFCEEALGATDDDRRVAEILVFSSWMHVLAADVYTALELARAGLERAERVGDASLLARAIARVALAETWTLDITPGLLERGVALEGELGAQLEYPESPTMALARRLVYLNELDRARELLYREEQRAAGRADEGSRGHLLFYELILEHQAGDWRRGLDLAAAALELAEQLGDEQFRGMAVYGRAVMLAHLGEVEETRAVLADALELAESVGDAHFEIWARSLLGFLELSLGKPHEAIRHLRPLPDRLAAQGWNEPADPWPDTVEALVAVGELDEARAMLDRFEALAERLGAPRGLATATRCRALLAAAEGNLDSALDDFERALALHRRLEEPFEHGRTWLALGATRRRARQKRDARIALERALTIFERLGARLWAERVHDELARLPGRRPTRDVLTEAEARVAALAAEGRSNKEIAATLTMSVHTVEAHLTRTYRKLGIRSRRELAGHESLAGRLGVKV
jgi:ATP/maltotriose-dependent transcriptional regulator MalT